MSGEHGTPCPQCNGTGCDEAKTAAMRKREPASTGSIRCWNCNGNGLDPAAYFRWNDATDKKGLL
jgi:hypothetical protein